MQSLLRVHPELKRPNQITVPNQLSYTKCISQTKTEAMIMSLNQNLCTDKIKAPNSLRHTALSKQESPHFSQTGLHSHDKGGRCTQPSWLTYSLFRKRVTFGGHNLNLGWHVESVISAVWMRAWARSEWVQCCMVQQHVPDDRVGQNGCLREEREPATELHKWWKKSGIYTCSR